MNSFRSAINFPTMQTGFTIKKQFAYIGLQMISKYQQQLSEYLKYSTKFDSNGDIVVTVQPVQTLTEQKKEPYKSYVIYK